MQLELHKPNLAADGQQRRQWRTLMFFLMVSMHQQWDVVCEPVSLVFSGVPELNGHSRP
jgi:hypothetical protein